MPYFVGLDASKRATQICVIDESGAVVSEGPPLPPRGVGGLEPVGVALLWSRQVRAAGDLRRDETIERAPHRAHGVPARA
jgi:hypothetical protein